jgi:rhamnogalacturonan endolyase
MKALVVFCITIARCFGQDFVLIRGGELPGQPEIRVDDFEMQSAPVTNAEYKIFVDATGHPAPLHWSGDRVPPGMEQHPVIFVNRFDAVAYAKWRTAKESRLYRLPSVSEFEYAARAGSATARYPWGDEAPEGKANYDPKGERTFAQWREYVRPVRSYAPNKWGLYDLAGNVWQMVDRDVDLPTNRFVYRVTDVTARESGIAGGSWARSEYYLRNGVFGGASSGMRHPDLGFRLVREPAGTTHFRRQPRRLVALPAGNGGVWLSWQLLAEDGRDTGFHIYRSRQRHAAGFRITNRPVTASTSFTDASPPAGGRVYYRVRAVSREGREGPPSEWAGVNPGDPRTSVLLYIDPEIQQGSFVPVFGDLTGDGSLDVVLKLDNGIREMSRDPGVPVELEAYTAYGRSLWRRKLVDHEHCFGNANNVPVVVYDLDGDGRAEVIARYQEGDKVYLAVLEGMTGRVQRKTPWREMATDFAKSSTRIHMAVAYLDGKTPAIVTQTGLYENEIIDAYDVELRRLWTYESFAETNGSGSHSITVADVDGDGRDEVVIGSMVLNADGSLRWSIYREHPDIVAVKHILPGSKDRQIFYAVETSVHAGAYLVDAKSGKMIWKVNREEDPRWTHAHMGWAADIWDGSPGMEMLTNRDGHLAADQVLFAASGKILMNPFPPGWHPVNWTGGKVRDLMRTDGGSLGRFTGRGVEEISAKLPQEHGKGSCRMVADLAGDYRDEIVCIGTGKSGGPALFVYTNTDPLDRREVTRTASHEYRLWLARNLTGGYGSYFEWEP